MKRSIKRILKRIFLLILVAFTLYLVATNISFFRDLARRDTIRIIVDTDAGYGVDDLFALSRLLMNDNVQIIGLLSSQWHYADLENDSTLYLSHDDNYRMLRIFNRTHIPRRLGVNIPVIFDEKPYPRDNQAARFIADRAMETVSGQKLDVLCLGPSTNLATAVLRKPESASRIRCHMLGPVYDPARRIWNKNEFNARNDLDALDILLNNKDLELHIMNANMAESMVFTGEAVRDELRGDHPLQEFLRNAFRGPRIPADTCSMPSLVLVEAILNPDLASEKQVLTPPENEQRKVSVYTRADIERMQKDFWRSLGRYTGD